MGLPAAIEFHVAHLPAAVVIERVVNERPFQFEWDQVKADANLRKHGITFELASTVFFDPNLLTVADVDPWSDSDRSAIKVRLISAR